MSWLIEEESIDRFILDDIGGNALSGHFELNLLGSDREDGDSIENDIVILPPVDVITLRNSSSIFEDTSNFIINEDQESIHSGMTILPSCSSSSMNTLHEQVASIQDMSNIVSMIDENDAALSLNVNSIDSSLLTEFSGSPLLSSVNSCESSVSFRDAETEIDEAHTAAVGSINSDDTDTPFEDNSQSKNWYNHFKSEEEWDEFREKTKHLLDAVDCPMDERNEMIAQLINLEEELFWNCHGDQPSAAILNTTKLSWLFEVVALSASIAVAGVVIVRFLKCR
jgi:hypothetical protein